MGLKPTTELLIKAFTLSRCWPENSAALTWHFAVLLVLCFICFVFATAAFCQRWHPQAPQPSSSQGRDTGQLYCRGEIGKIH